MTPSRGQSRIVDHLIMMTTVELVHLKDDSEFASLRLALIKYKMNNPSPLY